MNEIEHHDATWDDRLQDLADGEVPASERVAIESHLASCSRCRTRYAALRRLDHRLSSKLDRPHLDSGFDSQLLARIEALDSHAREQAQGRAVRELEESLQALSRGWRRGIAFLLGGSIAGIALALACMTWIEAAGVAHKLADAASAAGLTDTDSLHTLMVAAIGAAIGGGVSRWLAQSLE